MATGTLAPMFWFTCLDDDGLIVPDALYNFYLSGTTTPASVYRDADLMNPYTQPAEGGSDGRFVAYLDPAVGNLKLIVTDGDGVPIGPTVDPVTPTNAGASGLGEVFTFGSQSSSPITVTSYPSGASFVNLQPGTSVWQVDPATLTGDYIIEATGVQDTAGTLSVALVNLTDGSPDTPLATASITSLTGEVAQSGTITFPAGGAVKQMGIKTKVSANTGFLIGVRVVRTA